ncbi:hypothetical protein [Streptomyces sp. WAC06614]|uniref:hypothetical protein n=1 Tax=Streptomyces sp. WAC06614 TaxID=2487416 RepID=UPI000F7897B8|nr:hypothetical protein [Streptomyces sp. WAC06614]RSS72786.1 hypothetical protein EF918_26285 [Streptomyces sp. WAC06614]
MIWWLRSRAVAVLAASTLLTALASLAVGNVEIPVPVLAGQAGKFLLADLITVLPAVLWINGTGRASTASEITAVRPVHRWDTTLAAALATAGLAVTGLAHVVGITGVAVAVGRNIAVYMGIALLLNPIVGPRIAAPLTAVFPLVCAAAGWRSGGGAEPWALILHRPGSAPAFAAGIILLVAGCVVSFLKSPATGALRLRRG